MRSALILFTLFLGLFISPLQAQQLFTLDTHYTALNEKVPVETGDKIEVREVFWYGCPHCYKIEEPLNDWLKTLPEEAQFTRMPAIFSPKWEKHARYYYTLEALEVLDTLHGKVFTEIHANKNKLDSDDAFIEFAMSQNLNRYIVKDTLESFAVNAKIAAAKINLSKYGIGGVPAFVINGEYMTDVTLAGGHANMFQVIEFLINKIQSEKKLTP